MRKLLFVLLFALAACSKQGLMDKLASPQDQAQAIGIANQIRDGRLDQLTAVAEPQLAPQLPGFMAKVRPIIAGVPGDFTIHGLNTIRTVGGPVTQTYILQAGGGNRFVLVTVVLEGTKSPLWLNGVNVTPASIDPTQINAFRLSDQGAGGIVWIAVMILCVIVSLAGMILPWIGGRWLKHRWAWTIGSFFAIFSFALDWRSGHVLFTPLSVIFLGARTMRPGDYAPWFLAWGIPVVAIIVLVKWFRRGRDVARRAGQT